MGAASSAVHEEITAANCLVHTPQASPAKTGICPFPALLLSLFALFLVWQGGCVEKRVWVPSGQLAISLRCRYLHITQPQQLMSAPRAGRL